MNCQQAVITGGSGDLAGAIRVELENSGYEVHCPGRSELDVTRAGTVTSWFRDRGAIDLLINNAGIVRDRPVSRMTVEDWDEVIATNLKGAFLCSQAALKTMSKQRSGHIIQIGSYSGIHPPAGQANYAASKAGLIGLTKSLAKEFGKRNIRVNCVLPGFLETRMTGDLSETAVEAARNRHSLGRFNTTAEAAAFVRFLAGTEHISGQMFQLDSRC